MIIDAKFSSILLVTILSIVAIQEITFEQDKPQQQPNIAYAADLSDFNFAAAGDWGCFPDAKRTVNNIVDKHPELVLALGDFSYENIADCWFNIISPIEDRIKIAIGNHDIRPPSLLAQYMTHFGLTKQYYSFDYHNVHFLVMSTEIPLEVGSEQFNFVNNDLAKAATDPAIDWIVVYCHKPAYTLPSVDDDGMRSSMDELRDIYHPLFDKYNVDLVLQGHDHNYQRSYPIKYNSTSPSTPIITDTNNNNYNNPSGRISAVVGTGGIGLYSLSSGNASYLAYKQSSSFGFLNVDVINNGTTLNAKFYDNDGAVEDKFTVTKSKNTSSSRLQLPSTIPTTGGECTTDWYITGYFTPVESDYSGSKRTIFVEDVGSKSYPSSFLDAVEKEGWGKTNEDFYIGRQGSGGEWVNSDYAQDSIDQPLKIGLTVAVDPSMINHGTKLKVPTLPGEWGRLTYTANDIGKSIKGKHIDVFTGEGKSAEQQTFEITGRGNTVCLYT
jgi:Calcineurin-like phosphoesterase/3D domain